MSEKFFNTRVVPIMDYFAGVWAYYDAHYGELGWVIPRADLVELCSTLESLDLYE